ncbi:tRNA (adenosine(37)-N6)-threonylcarbamoyltransferase complex ATPase subunit type 1 TsaE [candidate division WOR-3 bacterium]|nr:tRNA (adenosine(37)-N6)-threonylcarbamoyltransferase complex ATPase subunit type 1 TsaE [candidate division WOR-3 bacterium]
MIKLETKSPAETYNLGRRIARGIRSGDVLAFKGELGSGKTTLIQGIIEGLGVAERVQSPSFVLVRTYHADFEIKHVDLYRLDPQGVDGLHLEEIYSEDGVMLVEWSDHAGWLPGRVSFLEICFSPENQNHRRITVSGPIQKRLA